MTTNKLRQTIGDTRTRQRGIGVRSAAILLAAALAVLAAPSVSSAVEVKTVPWVAANPLIPHDTWSGNQVTLKGTTDVSGAGIEYSWDFGDASPPVVGVVTNPNIVEALHTYVGSPGDVFTARLTVTDTGTGDSDSQTYFVAIRDMTLEVEVNVAIDEGLWYLHKNRIDTTCGALACSHWGENYSSYAAVAASTINAFEANGHLESGDPSNPYVETVQRGLRFLFTRLVAEGIGLQTNGTGVVDPDSNGNGIGIRVNEGNYPYIGGAVIDAIVTSGTPGAVAVTGGANVFERTYEDIVQDMIDSYAYGQYDFGASRGGWRYAWNQNPDASASQWGAIGMIPAEQNWGSIVPAWVKTENLVWLDYNQYYTGLGGSEYYFGAFGYTGKGEYVAGTASGMVQLALDGVLNSDGRWLAAEKWMREHWTTAYNHIFNSGADYYAMFAFTKAMRLANPAAVVEFGSTSALGLLDWYSDPTQGFARRLVDMQNANGSWSGGSRWYIYPQLSTPWSILILGQTLFEAGSPVAVAEAVPNPGVVGQTINLDGSASFHQDPNFSIDSWDWDLDGDGECDDASGPLVATSYAALGDYDVTLCVTDDDDPEKTDDTTIVVRITIPPIEPTADADGPYSFCPQTQPWFLDGTGSSNPDEGESEPGQPGDTIQEYAWDLDGNASFDDAFGPQPDVTAALTALGPGEYLIQLRVTDTTATSFPSSGMGDLSDTDASQVRVRDALDPACACVDDLAAVGGAGEITLSWSDTGAAEYHVYRATTQGGPYSFIGSTTDTSFVDSDVVGGIAYFYVVREAELSGVELCQSNEAVGEATDVHGVCDVDGDGDVDRHDTEAIFDARGTAASGPDDPMDANGDGIITINDARLCVLECDLENCEVPVSGGGTTTVQGGCGLLGIEPFLLLGLPLWARRRRGGCL